LHGHELISPVASHQSGSGCSQFSFLAAHYSRGAFKREEFGCVLSRALPTNVGCFADQLSASLTTHLLIAVPSSGKSALEFAPSFNQAP
jgi:hypothetical protein